MKGTDKRVVLITASGEEEAINIARDLVTEKLAACVNIVPAIRSIYRWEGKIHDDAEVLLIVKTNATSFNNLRDRVASIHSYANPEIISLPIDSGSEKYLEWLDANLAD